MPHTPLIVGSQLANLCISKPPIFLTAADREVYEARKIENKSKSDLIKLIMDGEATLAKDNIINELHLLNGARFDMHIKISRDSIIGRAFDTKLCEKSVDYTLAQLTEEQDGAKFRENLAAARDALKELRGSINMKEDEFQQKIRNQRMLSGQIAMCVSSAERDYKFEEAKKRQKREAEEEMEITCCC